MATTTHKLMVPADAARQRLDAFVAAQLPSLSRSRIAVLAHEGLVTVSGRPCRPAKRVEAGDEIVVVEPLPPATGITPVAMSLVVLYEDEHLAVLDKPPGLVVHPGAATHAPTLVHGLLHQYPELHGCIGHERPGIVHRLDRDTSGCILIARTEAVRLQLLQQFSRRCVRKVYYALVQGVPRVQPLRIERPIGRSDHDRKKMSATATHGREAITEARVLEHFNCGACALEVRIMTGRTHQIRVHLAYVGLPVLGDRVYGRAARDLSAAVQASRQMLHAQSLAFRHPITGAPIECAAPLPSDIHAVCARLRTLEQ